MNLKETAQILDDISGRHVPQDVNLLPGVLSKVQKTNHTARNHRARIALIFMSIIAVFTLLFTFPEIASAMRKLLGFIPGIGLVNQDSPLRVLAEPVTVTRDGFTVTVENAVLDSKHTIITYKVEGPFNPGDTQSTNSLDNTCFSSAELHLPDGTIDQLANGIPSVTWNNGYRTQYSYIAVPDKVQQAELVLPCIYSLQLGSHPENWKIPLNFVSAPDDLTIYPIGLENTPASESPSQGQSNIKVNLENVIPLADGQLVQVRIDWSNTHAVSVTLDPKDVEILDASGKQVSFEPSSEAIDPGEFDLQSRVFGFKTSPLTDLGSAKIILKAASEVTYNTFEQFTITPGSANLENEVIDVNSDIDLNGHILHIKNVTIDRIDGNATLSVEMESNDGIIAAGIFDLDNSTFSGASSEIISSDSQLHQFWISNNYEGDLPNGQITLTVMNYTLREQGSWQVDWTPMPAPSNEMSAPMVNQTPCITKADWETAFASSSPLPVELNRKVVFETYDSSNSTNKVSMGYLDGSEQQLLIKDGYNPALSPDGERIAYTDKNGNIFIYDIQSGTNNPLEGSFPNPGLVMLYWSPDGNRIGFTGSPVGSSPDLYLNSLDGSGSMRLIDNNLPKLMQGWTPEGNILYLTLDENGPVMKRVNPKTGESSSLFNVPNFGTSLSISTDGSQYAMNPLDEQSGKQSLDVFGTASSPRKTLLQVDKDGYILGLRFTPDGAWLLVNLSWSIPDDYYSQALVNIASCQVIPVKNLPGRVIGWLP